MPPHPPPLRGSPPSPSRGGVRQYQVVEVDPSMLTSRQPDSAGAADEPSAALTSLVGEISVINARKAFGVTRALDGCTFNAHFGEIHAIVGGNGSGKSTLAKVLSGVLPLDSGQVSVFGQAPTSPHQARALGIATVFQEVLVADECSVVDNLFVGADSLWSKSIPNRQKVRTAAALMRELTGTDIDPEMLVGGLPLSVKQWITIGRALLCKPRLLILDESSAALDLAATEKLFEKMRELRDQGAAVLIVTHRIAELIRISDRATVLRDGRTVGVLEKSDITEKNLLGLMTGKTETAAAVREAGHEVVGEDVVLRTRGLKIRETTDPIDFDLLRGEIVGVTGLDGQGQNEFVRILAGVQAAGEGLPAVRDAAGAFVDIRDLADADRHRVAYVSGDRKREGVFPNLSIFENLILPLYRRNLRGGALGIIDWGALANIFGFEVERLAIKMEQRSNPITSLSGGNQQKVLIGRSFALDPNVLVLNDPARGVDLDTKNELYRHLRGYAARGKSIVYMSSEIEEFLGLCSRVIVFRHGGIFDMFTSGAIVADRILEAMFGQTEGLRRKDDGVERRGTASMKIVEFDKEEAKRPSQELVGGIKVVDFGRADGPAEAAPAGEAFRRQAPGTAAHQDRRVRQGGRGAAAAAADRRDQDRRLRQGSGTEEGKRPAGRRERRRPHQDRRIAAIEASVARGHVP